MTLKYREEALAHRQSNLSYDELIQLTPPYLWLLLVIIFLLLTSLILWSFFGSVTTRATGSGILVGGNGGIYNAIAPAGANQIKEINVKVGEYVTQGKVVASLDRPDLKKQIETAQLFLQRLQKKYDELQKTATQEIKLRQEYLEQERQGLETSIKSQQEDLKSILNLLEVKQAAFKKGLLTRQDIAVSEHEFYAAKLTLQETQDKLVQLQISESNTRNEWRDRLREQETAIAEKQQNIAQLQAELINSQRVISPFNGVISGIHKSAGDNVTGGSPILSIAQTGQGLDAIVFVPSRFGQQVTSHMKALLTPIFIKKEEYGSLKGSVVNTNVFPSTPDSMEALLHNEQLVKQFSTSGPVTSIRVRLSENQNNYSGFQWTTGTGPQQKITAGMLVTVQINIRHQAPISLLVPAFRKLLGE
ncbi:MAG: NHLP bacteriocin system secretion protein [Legionella sp.]|uniref:NHLP bacteriocin system secretion protein n=1 Tax=Legionella sp. TaxID=459 RepID=UPI00284DC2F0|nr:NHLP bacteriocin system secretion protein [Legionella sp.]